MNRGFFLLFWRSKDGNNATSSKLSSLLPSLFSCFLPQLFKLSGHFLAEPSARQFFDFENQLHKHLLWFGGLITEQIVLMILDMPEFAEQAIAHYRRKGYRIHDRKRSTKVQLLSGRTVSVKTPYMLPQQENKRGKKHKVGKRGKQGKGIYPILAMLGMCSQASPALQSEVTLAALNNPFNEANENLQRRGIDISEKRVRTVSEKVGCKSLEARERELAQFEQGTAVKGDTYAGQRVVVSVDGGRVRTRQTKSGRKKKGQKRHGSTPIGKNRNSLHFM